MLGRSLPGNNEFYNVNHQNVIDLSHHVLQLGFNKQAIFVHFHRKGNAHGQLSQDDLIKYPPIDIIRLDEAAVQLLLERLVWADTSREVDNVGPPKTY